MPIKAPGKAGKDRLAEIKGYLASDFSPPQIAKLAKIGLVHVRNCVRLIRRRPDLTRKVLEGELGLQDALSRIKK